MVNLSIEEIIAGNDIFAMYMNLETGNKPTENLLYHEDYNWLNAVIEKIEKTKVKEINNTPHTVLMHQIHSFPDRYSFQIDARQCRNVGKSFTNTSESKIEVLWITALQFVKWQMKIN